MPYNAIAVSKSSAGRVLFRHKVEVDSSGKLLRASGFTSPTEGSPEFDEVFRNSRPGMVASLEIIPCEDPEAFMRAERDGQPIAPPISPHAHLKYQRSRR